MSKWHTTFRPKPNYVDFTTIKRPQIFVLTQAENKTEKIPIFISVLREKIDINRFEKMEKTDSSTRYLANRKKTKQER